MSWALGFDTQWQRDIGYGVPAFCDHPDCGAEIDRGLSFVCGARPYGGETGCGLYFCHEHQSDADQHCEHCAAEDGKEFTPSPDAPRWIAHKLCDGSWAQWRAENPNQVRFLRAALRSTSSTRS